MKILIIAAILSIMLSGTSIYDFKVKGLDGNEINFSEFKGRKLLIVNTASNCGHTPQYAELQRLFENYEGKIWIVGFPANNFGGQEPGTNAQIREVCEKNYGVTFPMAEKISVAGDDMHPIYKYLNEEAKKLGMEGPVVKWNFTKFLIDENGKLIKVFPSKVSPLSEEITVHLN